MKNQLTQGRLTRINSHLCTFIIHLHYSTWKLYWLVLCKLWNQADALCKCSGNPIGCNFISSTTPLFFLFPLSFYSLLCVLSVQPDWLDNEWWASRATTSLSRHQWQSGWNYEIVVNVLQRSQYQPWRHDQTWTTILWKDAYRKRCV